MLLSENLERHKNSMLTSVKKYKHLHIRMFVHVEMLNPKKGIKISQTLLSPPVVWSQGCFAVDFEAFLAPLAGFLHADQVGYTCL